MSFAGSVGADGDSVVVVGGGITGLTVAFDLARSGMDVSVLEASDRLGGKIRTVCEGEIVMDTGPDSFLKTKPDGVRLAEELGLGEAFITTREEARRVYFVHAGRLVEMPGGMALAVPTRLEPLMSTPLLSAAGKTRLFAEPLVPKRRATPDDDESIEAFFSRRFGEEAARRLAGPLLGGVYAGDTSKLSIRSTFPQLVEMEQKHGSLVLGMFAAQGGGVGGTMRQSLAGLDKWLRREGVAQAASPFFSFAGGMQTLVDALAARLPEGVVRLGTPVRAVRRKGDRWQVEASDGVRDASSVVLAVPAGPASELVDDPAIAAELSEVPLFSTATVFLAFDRASVDHPLDGLGFIAPRGEAEILAGTWVSTKWPGRAPDGTVLMRAFVGGPQAQERVQAASDDELADLAMVELRRLMGRLEAPKLTRVFRYDKASPQPNVGHGGKMERVNARLRQLAGLYIVGGGYDGVGIPDCIRQARVAASAILAQR